MTREILLLKYFEREFNEMMNIEYANHLFKGKPDQIFTDTHVFVLKLAKFSLQHEVVTKNPSTIDENIATDSPVR